MKTSKLDIARYIVEENFYKYDHRLILQENNNVKFKRIESKIFKQYP